MKTHHKPTPSKRPVKPPSSRSPHTTSIPRPFALGAVLCLCLAIVAWKFPTPWTVDSSRHEPRTAPVYVRSNETIDATWDVECKGGSWVGDEVVPGCTPPPCRRHVTHLPSTSLTPLTDLFRLALSHTSPRAGPTIFDLASGALSLPSGKFASLRGRHRFPRVVVDGVVEVAREVKSRVERAFGCRDLEYTKPMFFSRITPGGGDGEGTQNDEYWHPHIDKLQYGSFTYTALIYLSSLHTNFTGGRFLFDDGTIVEPSLGLLSSFTSGAENVHWVEKVETGERWAFTCAFTCGKGNGNGGVVDLEDVRRKWSDEFEG